MPLLIKGVSPEILKNNFFNAMSDIPEIIALLATTVEYETPVITTFGSLPAGTDKYLGGIVARNGKVYFSPCRSGIVKILDPATKNTTDVVISSPAASALWTGAVLASDDIMYGVLSDTSSLMEFDTITNTNKFRPTFTMDDKFSGGVVKGNNIIFVPCNYTKVYMFDTVTKIFSSFGNFSGTSKWFGGVLHPNGKIYCIPWSASQILEVDSVTQQTRLIGNISGALKWAGGVLAPDGKIYGIPYNHGQVLEFDPETDSVELFGNLGTAISKWMGGVLAPNGRIYGIPRNASSVLEIDPITKTTSLLGNVGTTAGKWGGGVLAHNGKIYGVPLAATTILEIDTLHLPSNPDICTHPYFNKF